MLHCRAAVRPSFVWMLSMYLPRWVPSLLCALFFAAKQYICVFDGRQPVVNHPHGHLNVMVLDKAEAKHMQSLVYKNVHAHLRVCK